MGDRLLIALAIAAGAVLIAAGMWALLAYNRRLDGKPKAVCGEHGPGGMRCSRPPHDRAERHEQDGIGWRTPAWHWPGNERPPQGGDR